MSDSPGLADFGIAQVTFFEEFKQQKNCEINCAIQKGLVEMTSGLVNASFSLPE